MDGRYSKWLCFYMALSFEYGLLLQIRSFPYIWATLGTLGIWGACQFFSFLGGYMRYVAALLLILVINTNCNVTSPIRFCKNP